MATTRTAMMLWLVLGVVTARSLPDQRFASLEGEMMQSASGFCSRMPRHLSDFAEFDRPLADDGPSLQRFARGVDSGDELGIEFNTLPPEMEEEYESEYTALAPKPEAPEAPKAVFVDALEEMSGLSEVDEPLPGDAEATISKDGPEVLLADGEMTHELGSPARKASLETSDAEKAESAEEAEEAEKAEKAEKVDKQEEKEIKTTT